MKSSGDCTGSWVEGGTSGVPTELAELAANQTDSIDLHHVDIAETSFPTQDRLKISHLTPELVLAIDS
jgi:hypothetical protein